MAAGLLSCGICSILCSVSVPGVPIEPFVRKVFFVCLSGDPTVWVAVSHQLPQTVLRAFRPGPYPKDQLCSLHLPAQPPLTGGGPECLGHFSAGSCAQVRILWCFCFCFCFPSWLCCPLRFQNSPQTLLCEDFLLCGDFSSFLTPSPGWASVPKSFASVFVFYILSYLLLKRSGCLSGCLVSSASIQKLFCGSCSAFK